MDALYLHDAERMPCLAKATVRILVVLNPKDNAMTRNANRVDYPDYSKCVERRAEELEVDRPSPERTQAANEVGSAIAHQLNGPFTALRLYIGEISGDRFRETAEAPDGMQQMVEAGFQETERLCAMMNLIADRLEKPLYPESAAARGRDVISRWSRSGSAEGGDYANGGVRAGAASSPSIHSLLTPRERRVLGHVSQGCSNKQSAIGCKSARGRSKVIAPG